MYYKKKNKYIFTILLRAVQVEIFTNFFQELFNKLKINISILFDHISPNFGLNPSILLFPEVFNSEHGDSKWELGLFIENLV